MTATKTAIVILNWNGEGFLKKFLPGVIRHSQADATVFVADNASTDNSIAYLQSLGDAVKIIQLDKNYGNTRLNLTDTNIDLNSLATFNSSTNTITMNRKVYQNLQDILTSNCSFGNLAGSVLSSTSFGNAFFGLS